jgi:hypothetical protein
MIEFARQRVPEARFHVKSFLEFRIPACRAVTALREVFSYLIDPNDSLRTLRLVWEQVFDALAPHGLLVFDVAGLDRCKGIKQRFFEGKDWACVVEFHKDKAEQKLTRRIVSFRRVGDTFRRHEETHTQLLYSGAKIVDVLRQIGFRVRQVRSYGDRHLSPGVAAFIARKP